MADNELSKEVREQLEVARSKVRRVLTYGGGIVAAILVLWGSLWMGDRSIMLVGITAGLNLMFYWFGQRSVKPPEIK